MTGRFCKLKFWGGISMAYLIGSIVGGVILMLLLTMLFEWLIGRRVTDTPAHGIPVGAMIAYAVAVILAGFGNANGGSWNPGAAWLFYAIGAAVAVAILLPGALRRQRERSDLDEVASRFE